MFLLIYGRFSTHPIGNFAFAANILENAHNLLFNKAMNFSDLPAGLQVQSVTPGVFGASIVMRGEGGLQKYTKHELLSCLQKAIRRQDFRLAAQATCVYLALFAQAPAQLSTTGVSNLLRRLPVIACEDCAHLPDAFRHACDLHDRYMAGKKGKTKTVTVTETLAVVNFLCTHGTSRLPSHMRALEGTVASPTPERDIVRQVQACLQVRQRVPPYFVFYLFFLCWPRLT